MEVFGLAAKGFNDHVTSPLAKLIVAHVGERELTSTRIDFNEQTVNHDLKTFAYNIATGLLITSVAIGILQHSIWYIATRGALFYGMRVVSSLSMEESWSGVALAGLNWVTNVGDNALKVAGITVFKYPTIPLSTYWSYLA